MAGDHGSGGVFDNDGDRIRSSAVPLALKLPVGFQFSLTAAKLDFSFGEDCLLILQQKTKIPLATSFSAPESREELAMLPYPFFPAVYDCLFVLAPYSTLRGKSQPAQRAGQISLHRQSVRCT